MSSNTTSGRKRSKWDQTTSEVVKPSKAAAEAAARLNAKLAAEGKLVQSNPPQLPVRVLCVQYVRVKKCKVCCSKKLESKQSVCGRGKLVAFTFRLTKIL